MAGAMGEVVRLNMVTAVLILASSVIRLLIIYDRSILLIFVSTNVLYILSNPIVYMLIMTDLRRHYVRCMRTCHNRLCGGRDDRGGGGSVNEHSETVATTQRHTEVLSYRKVTALSTV